MNCNWYLVHAKAKQEAMAEMNLQHLGVETFYPRVSRYKPNRYQHKTGRTEPLFPGYLFVRVDMSTEFRKVTHSHGVVGVVKFGATPALVEDKIIDSIKARSHSDLGVIPTFTLDVGETVCIDKGPFQGFEAIFEKNLNGMQRVAILLKTISYQGHIVIDRDCLSRLSSPQ